MVSVLYSFFFVLYTSCFRDDFILFPVLHDHAEEQSLFVSQRTRVFRDA